MKHRLVHSGRQNIDSHITTKLQLGQNNYERLEIYNNQFQVSAFYVMQIKVGLKPNKHQQETADSKKANYNIFTAVMRQNCKKKKKLDISISNKTFFKATQ